MMDQLMKGNLKMECNKDMESYFRTIILNMKDNGGKENNMDLANLYMQMVVNIKVNIKKVK